MFSKKVNTVIWFVIIKKGEFVEPILIAYKVLMITNANEMLLECVDQTSST